MNWKQFLKLGLLKIGLDYLITGFLFYFILWGKYIIVNGIFSIFTMLFATIIMPLSLTANILYLLSYIFAFILIYPISCFLIQFYDKSRKKKNNP
jgi:hypothetical protein